MNENNFKNMLNNIEVPETLSPEIMEEKLKGKRRRKNVPVVVLALFLAVSVMLTGGILINRNIAVVSDTANNSDGAGKIAPVENSTKAENKVEDYKPIYAKMENAGLFYDGDSGGGILDWFHGLFGVSNSMMAEDGAAKEEANNSFQSNAMEEMDTESEHYEGNMQVTGVEEPEIAKTDGKYIYTLGEKTLYIVGINNGDLTLVSSTPLEIDADKEETVLVKDMFLNGDKLAVLMTLGEDYMYTCYDGAGGVASDVAYMGGEQRANILIFDVSDKEKPKEVSSLGQSGYYMNARMAGDKIYIMSNYAVNEPAENKPETYVPQVFENGDKDTISAGCIQTPDAVNYANYVNITAIDLNSPDKFYSTQSVLGGMDVIYASLNNIYISTYDYNDGEEQSEIFRFYIGDGSLTPAGHTKVKGTILDQFSMDEDENGYFRVVSQQYNFESNIQHVTVFDNDLNQTDHIEKSTGSETLRSVRFDGNLCHFVTFMQTDPLFTVDLSDPENLKVLDELKVPGYSEYLHPFDENTLLGIGKDANEETGVETGGKISLYDRSDPNNLKEISTVTIPGYGNMINHKEVIVDSRKNIIAFLHDMDYYVFSVEDGKLVEKGSLKLKGYDYMHTIKPFYKGDYIYVSCGSQIYSYNINTSETNELNLE